MASLTRDQRIDLLRVVYNWNLVAREKQKLPRGNWQSWLVMAGRGFGKTRTGAETLRIWKEDSPIMLAVGATAGDVRDIIIEGPGGILHSAPPWDRPVYEPSKSKITWNNGATCLLRSADEPDRFRGLQFYKAWADELASWRYTESWDQIMMGIRLGLNPQVIVTTTPSPTKIIKDLIKDPTTVVTHGTSYENKENLSPTFYSHIIKKYENTRIGRQELNAEILEDIEGSLWKIDIIEKYRVSLHPELKRIVIGLDPSTTANKDSDETGIIAVGIGTDGHGYVLEDATGIMTPNQWGRQAVRMYHSLNADRIVAEVNQGGDMVELVIRQVDPAVSYPAVHASRGKVTRAEPVLALYEQGKVHHVGHLPHLEDEMTTWNSRESIISPGRIDALVWGLTYLMLEKKQNTNYWE